jgi:hypothetical protein
LYLQFSYQNVSSMPVEIFILLSYFEVVIPWTVPSTYKNINEEFIEWTTLQNGSYFDFILWKDWEFAKGHKINGGARICKQPDYTITDEASHLCEF